MEQSANATKTGSSTRDADDIFGEYVANELKSITDCNAKRMVKFSIQSALFHSFNQQPPQMPNASPVQIHSHLPTTPCSWLAKHPSKPHSLSTFGCQLGIYTIPTQQHKLNRYFPH
jgi:hypothetical protein